MRQSYLCHAHETMHSSPYKCFSVFFIAQKNKYTDVEMLTEMQVYVNTTFIYYITYSV